MEDIVVVIGCCIAGFQLLYLGILLLGLLQNKSISDMKPVPISVIVCAHDEENNLRELVPVLLAQDHPDFELIIVEDRCNDGTYDFLLAETKKDSRLKMVRVAHTPSHINEKKYALTLGIKAAKHDYVLFTDADCRPSSPTWISTMSAHFDGETSIVIGYSSYLKQPGLLNSFIRFETLLTGIMYLSYALLGRPYMGVGRNLAYRKSLFLDKKGFNKILDVTGGDDDLFVNRYATAKNTRVAAGVPMLMVSKPKTGWIDFYYQKVRHLAAGKKYKPLDRLLLGLFTLSWILYWVFIVLLLSKGLYGIGAGLLLSRWVLLGALFRTGSKRLGEPFESWKIPYLDILYPFYYIVVGVKAWRTKRIKWKI